VILRSALRAVTSACSVEFGHRSASVRQAAHDCRFSKDQHYELRRGQPVGALAASFWRREREAEPSTRRSVLHSVRQGPVLISKLTNVSGKAFASFVRGIHPWPCRLDGRPPMRRLRAVLSGYRDARVDRVHDLAGALRRLLRLLLILQAGWPCIRAGYALAASGGSSRQILGRRALLACPVSAQLLRTTSLTETTLAFGIG
jgi:hypothetical protein